MKKPKLGQYVRFNALITPSQHKVLLKKARKEFVTASAIIRNLIASHL